jgi:GT2 family glycosyltransferase
VSGRYPSISVVVCSYADDRFDDLLACLESVRGQTLDPYDLVVVVDHNPPLLERLRRAAPDVVAIENSGPKGLSSARNTGVAVARGDVVAFLDDDAFAEPSWLERMAPHFEDERVAGVGGAILPHWSAGRPRWFPEEFDWVVGCTYRGLPVQVAPVRNLIGANMSFRREALAAAGGFALKLGRTGESPLGNNEDTELSIRVRRSIRGSALLYDPDARVRHRVPQARSTWGYYRRRCVAEGLAKAALSRMCGTEEGLSSEWAYVVRALPLGVLRGLRDTLTGDVSGSMRSLAICIGLLATTFGYATGRAQRADGRDPTHEDAAGTGSEPVSPSPPSLTHDRAVRS